MYLLTLLHATLFHVILAVPKSSLQFKELFLQILSMHFKCHLFEDGTPSHLNKVQLMEEPLGGLVALTYLCDKCPDPL